MNGLSIDVVNDGNITITSTDLAGGADAGLAYDESSGYRFFLDANYGNTESAGGGVAEPNVLDNAIEITNYMVPRSFNAANPITSVTIASGVIPAQPRVSSVTKYKVSNEGAAATDVLEYIATDNFSDGDLLTLYMTAANSYFSILATEGAGNIVTVEALKVGDTTYRKDIYKSITFHYVGGVFYEIARGHKESLLFLG